MTWIENLKTNVKENTIPFIALVLVFFVTVTPESDTWWLLRTGQEMFTTGHLVTKDYWSFTDNGAYWPNHETGFELLLFALWKLSFNNFILPALFFAVAVISSIFLLIPSEKIRKELSIGSAKTDFFIWLIIGCMIYLVSNLRPNAISIVFFSVLLYLIIKETWKFIPVLFLLWVNFHAGFLVGAILLFSVFVLSIVRAIFVRNEENFKRAKTIFITGVISFALTFLNPLGYKMWVYLLSSSSKPKGQVTEWLPIWQITSYYAVVFVGILFLTIPFIFYNIRKLVSWESQVLLTSFIITGILTILVIRFWYYFNISTIPLILLAYALTEEKLKKRASRKYTNLLPRLFYCLAPFILIIGCFNQWSNRESPIPANILAKVNACQGNVFNDYEAGAYLIWFNRDKKVFMDNRFDFYSDEVIALLVMTENDAWEATFEKYNISCALLQKRDLGLELLQENAWKITAKGGKWVFLEPEKV